MTNRLTVPQVIAMNEVLCIQSGEPAALLDRGGLEAAIERPWSGFGDTELFPSLYEKAAALLHAIASRQVFENGNKRTAWVAATTFLEVNGIDIGHTHPSQTNMFVRATGLDHTLTIAEIAEWLQVAHQYVHTANWSPLQTSEIPALVAETNRLVAAVVVASVRQTGESSGSDAHAQATGDLQDLISALLTSDNVTAHNALLAASRVYAALIRELCVKLGIEPVDLTQRFLLNLHKAEE
jgi:death-on-curing family protein